MTWHPVVNEWNTWEVWFRFYLFHPSPTFWLKNAVLGIERQAACHPLPCFPGSADSIWPPLLFTTTGNRHTSLAQRKVSTFQPDLQNTSQADLTCRILVYAASWASYRFWKKRKDGYDKQFSTLKFLVLQAFFYWFSAWCNWMLANEFRKARISQQMIFVSIQ